MEIKVAKFGGSSLADAGQFVKVRNIVLADSQRRYIVPSAPGKRNPEDQKVTDLLYLCHKQAQQALSFADTYNIISARFLELVKELKLAVDIEQPLERIRQEIAAGATADYIASRGEYLNGLILAALLDYDFVDPAECILFDTNGLFNPEATHAKIKQRLAQHEHAVIPGFYGATPDGTIKTFSRGGSDITGAIVARAVGAAVYENWTDVSGFLMADPRIVDNPRPIAKLTYRELRELAYMGASVLHEEAIFPVREAGIPVNIRNTNRPDDPGTLIVRDAEPNVNKGEITGIAGKKNFTVIAVEKTLMNLERGFGRKLLTILENNNISFEHIPSGIDTISLVIADSELDQKLEKVKAEIWAECKPDSVEVHQNMALIATVGRGMAATPGVAAKLFTALANAHVNVRMIDQGSSEINIIVGVESADFETAVRAIYQAFVN